MSSEKYINYYIESLTGALTEAVIKNISLQTNARITDEVIGEQKKVIDSLQLQLENNKKISEENNNNNILNYENTIKSKDATISEIQKQLTDCISKRNEYESAITQVQHLDTFRNELIKERDLHQQTKNNYEQRIKALNEQIEYLQLSPAKRKKIDERKETKEKVSEKPDILVVENTIIEKDDGNF